MDFSNSAFRAPPKVSEDTMSHANLVMACRWGWTSTPDSNGLQPSGPDSAAPQSSSSGSFNNVRSKRFAPCQGRLYHQLLCSHRIRTDLVEDCGANCVEPFGDITGAAFICNECVQSEALDIWEQRKTQHSALYPPISQMSKEQYDQFFLERQQLEAETARDRKLYEMELTTRMRPSNICSALEASKEEQEFATELDSLSLAMMGSSNGGGVTTAHHRNRSTLPSDSSEQLHWGLNSLALERGSCGVEYSASRPDSNEPALRRLNEDELWRKPRE
jgi:hypothetical protein